MESLKIHKEVAELVKKAKKLGLTFLTEDGKHEVNDPTPVEVPLGQRMDNETTAQKVRRILKIEMERQAADQGFETEEEANDLDVDDWPRDPATNYELAENEPMVPNSEQKTPESEPAGAGSQPAEPATVQPVEPETPPDKGGGSAIQPSTAE